MNYDDLDPRERRQKIAKLGEQYAQLSAQMLRLAAEVNQLSRMQMTPEVRQQIMDRVRIIRKAKQALEGVDRLLAELGASAKLVQVPIPQGVDPADPALNYDPAAIVPGRSSRRRR